MVYSLSDSFGMGIWYMSPEKNRTAARFFIYLIATFGFGLLPIVVHSLQRGALSGSLAFGDLFPSADWFVFVIAICAAVLAELGHEPKIGEAHLLIAVCIAIIVVLASYQYALLSSMFESLHGSAANGLPPRTEKWFSAWNIVLALGSTAFAVGVKLTESLRAD
jgi:hypothetical protein